MKDILGREIHKGDVVAYGVSKGGVVRYSDTRLGIVNNILGNKTHLASSAMYKKLFKEELSNITTAAYLPPSIDTIAKVTFYPLHINDKHLLTHPAFHKMHLNGKPKRGVILTTSFLKVNVADLSSDWLEAYTEARKAFRL